MKVKPEVNITKLTDFSLANLACEFTSNKQNLNVNMEKMYNAEHSPAYTQWFWIELMNLPNYVHTHFRTHEKNGAVMFVQTSRLPDGTRPKSLKFVNMAMMVNAQHLIQMARKRLCRKADSITRQVMQKIEREMYGVDRALAVNLRANCAYRMGCPEMKPCYEMKEAPNKETV